MKQQCAVFGLCFTLLLSACTDQKPVDDTLGGGRHRPDRGVDKLTRGCRVGSGRFLQRCAMKKRISVFAAAVAMSLFSGIAIATNSSAVATTDSAIERSILLKRLLEQQLVVCSNLLDEFNTSSACRTFIAERVVPNPALIAALAHAKFREVTVWASNRFSYDEQGVEIDIRGQDDNHIIRFLCGEQGCDNQ